MIFYTFQAWNQCIYKRSFETYTRHPYKAHMLNSSNLTTTIHRSHTNTLRVLCERYFHLFALTLHAFTNTESAVDLMRWSESNLKWTRITFWWWWCVFDTDANFAPGKCSNGHFLFLNSLFFNFISFISHFEDFTNLSSESNVSHVRFHRNILGNSNIFPWSHLFIKQIYICCWNYSEFFVNLFFSS